MSFTEIVSTKEKITLEEVQKFKFATKSVQFLFNRQTQNYCDNLYTEAYWVWSGKQKIDSLPEGEERDRSMGLWQDRRVWFNDQRKEIPTPVRSIFEDTRIKRAVRARAARSPSSFWWCRNTAAKF